MVSAARSNLMAAGIDPTRVHRMQGCDLCGGLAKFQGARLPDKVKPNQCVMLAFHRAFLERAQGEFDADPSLRFALCVEGDARLAAGQGAASLQRALGSPAARAPVLLGFDDRTRWLICGAHCLAVSRSSLPLIKARTSSEYYERGYHGLDTYLSYSWWQGEVRIPDENVFAQIKHRSTFITPGPGSYMPQPHAFAQRDRTALIDSGPSRDPFSTSAFSPGPGKYNSSM
ncbi:unnamed protein product, partial [Prorocentrum cordatum]